MSANRFLDRLHSACARSRIAVRLSLKLRNQAQCILGHYLSDGIDPTRNGEGALIELLRPHCSRVMDVGANVGHWSEAFLAGAARPDLRLIAYEPGQVALAGLRARFAGEERVTVRPVAVGATPGRAGFYEDPRDTTVSSLVPHAGASGAAGRDVEIVTLDQEAARLGWPAVDFVKIDAEGGDRDVLKGAAALLANRRIRFLQFEYNGLWAEAGATLKNVLRLLEDAGYRVFLITGRGVAAFDWLRYGEFFRYANFLALQSQDVGLLKDKVFKLH